MSSWGRRGKKKNPKIGCFAKGEADVTDPRVTEQGQEAEVKAGGGKKDLGFISRIKTAPSQDPPQSWVGFGEARTAENGGFKRGFNWEKYHGLSRAALFKT